MSITCVYFVKCLSLQVLFIVYYHNDTAFPGYIPLTGRRKPLPAAFP